MRDLNNAFVTCKKELDTLNIPYGNIVSVKPNSSAPSRWGQCKRLANGNYEITISTRLLGDTSSDEALKSTIIHEILHTCPNSFDHGRTWKRYASQVNNKYGYNIQRADSSTDKDIGVISAADLENYKYVFQCNKCGQIIIRSRASNFTKHHDHYRCAICKGTFNRLK